jgi:hypothetical protein
VKGHRFIFDIIHQPAKIRPDAEIPLIRYQAPWID